VRDGSKLLLVGIHYRPEFSGIAPYTAAAVDHLASVGADVLLLSGVPHHPHWKVPDEYRWRLRSVERRPGVAVRRLRHFVPSRQTAARRGLYEATFGGHVLVQSLPWRPDAVLAVVPSLLGAAAAANLARRHRAPFGLWIQDLVGRAATQSGIEGGGLAARMAGLVERRLVARAAEVAVIADSFRPYLGSLGSRPERLHTLPNWSRLPSLRGDSQRGRRLMAWREGAIIALHSGNMGLKQGLENVVEAAKDAWNRALDVRFVLMGDGNQRAVLERLGAGVPTLQFLPPTASADYADVLAAADVLLVNERVGVVDMSLPSKLTSYFAAGRPIVAAVDPGGGTAGEVQRSGAGRVVRGGRPAELVDAIVELAGDRDLAGAMGRRGIAYADAQLSEASAMARLERFVERLMGYEATVPADTAR
jgi:colanic acid biosynthesis glycosyl transferase WcaI